MSVKTKARFVPMLYISRGTMEIDFYKNAFGAVELRRWSNDDHSIHVADLDIDGVMFRVHEEMPGQSSFTPLRHGGATTNIGLTVTDVDAVMARAVAAGAREISPAQDYDYGYRQGEIADPFGHPWTIEMVI